jgi:predicted ferric reductase
MPSVEILMLHEFGRESWICGWPDVTVAGFHYPTRWSSSDCRTEASLSGRRGADLQGWLLDRGRRAHHWIGGALVVAVVIHVGGLWITSPPDMIDALLFASPTPFSAWGVTAMWAIFAVALLAASRRRLGLRTWRIAHMSLAVVIVAGSVVHGMLIEGTSAPSARAYLNPAR